MAKDILLKTKIEITKILKPKAAFINYLDINCGDVLEISFSVYKNQFSFSAKNIDIINLTNEKKLENYSLCLFSRNISDYKKVFEYNEI